MEPIKLITRQSIGMGENQPPFDKISDTIETKMGIFVTVQFLIIVNTKHDDENRGRD